MNDKNKDRNTKIIDWIIKIILVIIIIFLLIHNCELTKKRNDDKTPTGNIDIIEIKCDNNGCMPIPKQIEKLSFNQKKYYVKKDGTLQLIVKVSPSELSSSKFLWKSSDEKVAIVDSNGVIKGISTGTVTITVTSSNGKSTTCIVEVVNDEVSVKKIQLTPEKSSIDAGSLTLINAVIEPENATNRDLVWTSSDTSIATVDSKGVVKGIKPGEVTITAKTKDGKVVAKTTITVNLPQIESLDFSEKNVSVKKGNTLGLIVQVVPCGLSLDNLTWTSSNSNIATVDSNGVVKGINVGTATITVTSSNGKSATCKVEVVDADIDVKEIILTPNETAIYSGSSIQINAQVKPENATNRELVWSSSNSSVATVDSNGVVTGIKPGKVTITAKTKDGKVVANMTIVIEKEQEDGHLDVYDNEHTPLTWNGTSDLKIFSKGVYQVDGVIAPESSNTYQFVIKNSTKYKIKYSIDFIETNPYHINMKYKLKKNDTYLIDHYVSASELKLSNLLQNVGSNDTYYLEWKWISSSNDTEIGANPSSYYGIKIEVKAESTND